MDFKGITFYENPPAELFDQCTIKFDLYRTFFRLPNHRLDTNVHTMIIVSLEEIGLNECFSPANQ